MQKDCHAILKERRIRSPQIFQCWDQTASLYLCLFGVISWIFCVVSLEKYDLQSFLIAHPAEILGGTIPEVLVCFSRSNPSHWCANDDFSRWNQSGNEDWDAHHSTECSHLRAFSFCGLSHSITYWIRADSRRCVLRTAPCQMAFPNLPPIVPRILSRLEGILDQVWADQSCCACVCVSNASRRHNQHIDLTALLRGIPTYYCSQICNTVRRITTQSWQISE